MLFVESVLRRDKLKKFDEYQIFLGFRTTNHLETNFDSVEPSKEKQILEKV